MDTICNINGHVPLRMCVICRTRLPQANLIRLQKSSIGICKFNGVGRSFYICNNCIHLDNLLKRLTAYLKVPKDKSGSLTINIKEILFGQSSDQRNC